MAKSTATAETVATPTDGLAALPKEPFAEQVVQLTKLLSQSQRAFFIGAGCSKFAGDGTGFGNPAQRGNGTYGTPSYDASGLSHQDYRPASRQAVRTSEPHGHLPDVPRLDICPDGLVVPAGVSLQIVDQFPVLLAGGFLDDCPHAVLGGHLVHFLQDDLDRAAIGAGQRLPGVEDGVDLRWPQFASGQVDFVAMRLEQVIQEGVRNLPENSLRVKTAWHFFVSFRSRCLSSRH